MGESKSTVNWEGDSLVVVTKMDFQGTEIGDDNQELPAGPCRLEVARGTEYLSTRVEFTVKAGTT